MSCQSGNSKGREDKTQVWEQAIDLKLLCKTKRKDN